MIFESKHDGKEGGSGARIWRDVLMYTYYHEVNFIFEALYKKQLE